MEFYFLGWVCKKMKGSGVLGKGKGSTNDLPPLEQEFAVIIAAQQGDREAAAQLYSWFGGLLYRQVILSRLPNIEQAEDVLRDCFRIVFERIEQFTPKDRSIFFWIRRIAIHLVIDVYRRQKKTKRIAERLLAQDAVYDTVGDAPPSPDQGLFRKDARELIEGSFAKINPRYAAALRLRLLEDKSRIECATILEVTVSTFDVLLHRACKAFRENYPP